MRTFDGIYKAETAAKETREVRNVTGKKKKKKSAADNLKDMQSVMRMTGKC